MPIIFYVTVELKYSIMCSTEKNPIKRILIITPTKKNSERRRFFFYASLAFTVGVVNALLFLQFILLLGVISVKEGTNKFSTACAIYQS